MGANHRLGYHIMAPANWINDPNGLIQYKGDYHVFYQYHPFSPEWGPMHWGHVKSRDLVNWQHLPIAMAPDKTYDRGGCFSGSAVNDDGVLSLIYTGNADDRDPKQVQCLATSSDGITFEKYEGNPVIPYPPSEGSQDFRDPKVWKHGDKWFAVVGSGKDGYGKALLYRSDNLREWEYVGVAAQSDGSQGFMWECPDLFPINGSHILICSPIGMENSKNIGIIGDMDYETGVFTQRKWQDLDFGYNFYAAQTFSDDRGRRILFAWMNKWGKDTPTKADGWSGALTIPRELTLSDDGNILIQPVPELQQLRGCNAHLGNIAVVSGTANYLYGIQGDCLEIIAEFDTDKCSGSAFGLKIRKSADGKEETVLMYRVSDHTVVMDMSKSGEAVNGISTVELSDKLGKMQKIKFHIFVDRSSIEVFINDGVAVMTNGIYPKPDSLLLDLFSEGGDVWVPSIDVWTLNPIW